MHCNLRPPDVAPVVLGCVGQICTERAHKLLIPQLPIKILKPPLDSATLISIQEMYILQLVGIY